MSRQTVQTQIRSSLNRVFSVCYSDKHFVNSHLVHWHFIWEQNEKSVQNFRTFTIQANKWEKKYSKICVKWPLLKRPKIVFQGQLSLNAGQKYCRMLQGEHSSIAECSKGSIMQYLRPSLNYHMSLRPLFWLFLSGRFFTQVLLYVFFKEYKTYPWCGKWMTLLLAGLDGADTDTLVDVFTIFFGLEL